MDGPLGSMKVWFRLYFQDSLHPLHVQIVDPPGHLVWSFHSRRPQPSTISLLEIPSIQDSHLFQKPNPNFQIQWLTRKTWNQSFPSLWTGEEGLFREEKHLEITRSKRNLLDPPEDGRWSVVFNLKLYYIFFFLYIGSPEEWFSSSSCSRRAVHPLLTASFTFYDQIPTRFIYQFISLTSQFSAIQLQLVRSPY